MDNLVQSGFADEQIRDFFESLGDVEQAFTYKLHRA
jgi:hypothetical protein